MESPKVNVSKIKFAKSKEEQRPIVYKESSTNNTESSQKRVENP